MLGPMVPTVFFPALHRRAAAAGLRSITVQAMAVPAAGWGSKVGPLRAVQALSDKVMTAEAVRPVQVLTAQAAAARGRRERTAIVPVTVRPAVPVRPRAYPALR